MNCLRKVALLLRQGLRGGAAPGYWPSPKCVETLANGISCCGGNAVAAMWRQCVGDLEIKDMLPPYSPHKYPGNYTR